MTVNDLMPHIVPDPACCSVAGNLCPECRQKAFTVNAELAKGVNCLQQRRIAANDYVANDYDDDDAADVLPVPSIDWQAAAAEHQTKSATAHEMQFPQAMVDEDDDILPPRPMF